MHTISEEHLPQAYYAWKEVEQIRTFLRAEDKEFDRIRGWLIKWFRNLIVKLADLDGIRLYESILEITPEPGDTLEIRRLRILARINMIEPFDLVYLYRFLGNMLGWENFEVEEDGLYKGYLHVSVNTKDSNLFWLLYSELLGWIPANLILSFTQIVETEEPATLYPAGAYSMGYTIDVLPRTGDNLEPEAIIWTGAGINLGAVMEIT